MVSILYSTIKRYPLTIFLLMVIWYLSFFTPPKTSLEEVPFIDKWVHTAMYLGTCLTLWIEYIRQHRHADYEKLFFWAWIAPIIMSGIIELLQEYATGGRRSGDWLDLAANALGVTLAALIGVIVLKVRTSD
jgi:VanZ family protein